MPKWLQISIGCTLLALIVSLTIATIVGILEFRKLETQIVQLLSDADNTIITTSDNLNRPCGTNKPCGTLADVNQTLHTVRGTFGQIEIVANSFNRNQAVFFGQEAQIYSHFDNVLSGVSGTLGHTNEVIDGFLPLENRFGDVENQAYDEFGLVKTTTSDLDSFLKSEYFVGTTRNLYTISGNLGSLSDDITKKTHEFLYPAPCVGRICWLKRAYTITKDIGPLAEPFYFSIEAYKAIKNEPTF